VHAGEIAGVADLGEAAFELGQASAGVGPDLRGPGVFQSQHRDQAESGSSAAMSTPRRR
jgi:hypothetical protein